MRSGNDRERRPLARTARCLFCEALSSSLMLPSRRVTVKVPIMTRVAGTLAILAMLVGFVIFETWPARPRTWIGWAVALLVVLCCWAESHS